MNSWRLLLLFVLILQNELYGDIKMKKIFGVLFGLLLSASVFAGSGLGDLSKSFKALDGTAIENVKGTISADKELFPIVYCYVNGEHSVSGKIQAIKINLNKANVIENEYEITQKLYYKAALGNQCQESKMIISVQDGNFFVQTVSFVNYNVNSKGDLTGEKIEMSKKAMNQNSQNLVSDLELLCTQLNGEDYAAWADKAYSDFEIQLNLGNYAANRLKSKKWYEKHPLVGKLVDIPFMFTNIKESKIEGFDYQLEGLAGLSSTVLLKVLSNDDKYIDTKDETVLRIKGKVRDVSYSSEYEQEYKIIEVVIEEE